nr:winged helix-turn-helix domain-containing protein [Actinomadura sp. CNU-125]
MHFGVLGPLAVRTDDGTAVRVPETKVRAVLAALLAEPGRTVPADRLIDALWGDRPPRRPAGTLQARVSQLRKVLDDAEPGARGLIVTRPSGYALAAAPDAVDAGRFAALLVRARDTADALARSRLLGDALALWRGPAFADFADAPGSSCPRSWTLRSGGSRRWRSTRRRGWSWASTRRWRRSWRVRWRGIRCGSGCGRRTCAPCTGPGGAARPSPATTTCGSGSPRSWASIRARGCRSCTRRSWRIAPPSRSARARSSGCRCRRTS